LKTCLLCPNTIPAKHKLCYPCYRQYKDCMREAWFLALVELDKVQYKIDNKEQYHIDFRTNTDLYGVPIRTAVKSKRSVGRPRTDWKLIEEVLQLYDTSIENGQRLSVRALEKAMNRRIKFLTIWKIIKRYRKNIALT
jgi:hypothetical protein